MWKTKWKLRMDYFFARTIYKTSHDETPILMDSYIDNDYYYILNNNNHYIYSIDEVYELITTTMKDPFTREKIYCQEVIKVRIKKN